MTRESAEQTPPARSVWLLIGASMIALCIGLSAASYVVGDPLRNDFERFPDLRLLFVFFALMGGLCVAYLAAYARPQPAPRRVVPAVTAACLLVLWLGFPVSSRDVFGYAFLARMWGTLHVNPYVVSALEFESDPWFSILVRTLRRPLSVYGPLFLWQGRLLNLFAGESLWAAVWLHKAFATLLLVGLFALAARILKVMPAQRSPSAVLLLLVWNPLLLFEAASAAHNDIAMAFLLVAAIHFWSRSRYGAGLAFLALSFWYKWYSMIFVPVFLLDLLKTGGVRGAARYTVVWLVCVAVAGAILLAPLSGAIPSIVGQFLHPEKMRGIYPNELSPPLAALFWIMNGAHLFDSDNGLAWFNQLRTLFFVVALGAVMWRQWRAVPGLSAVTESCALVALSFFMLMITQLWPWHLLTAIVCCLLRGTEPFLRVGVIVTVLAVLSNFLTFAVAALMLLLIVASLWLMRRMRGSYPQPALS